VRSQLKKEFNHKRFGMTTWLHHIYLYAETESMKDLELCPDGINSEVWSIKAMRDVQALLESNVFNLGRFWGTSIVIPSRKTLDELSQSGLKTVIRRACSAPSGLDPLSHRTDRTDRTAAPHAHARASVSLAAQVADMAPTLYAGAQSWFTGVIKPILVAGEGGEAMPAATASITADFDQCMDWLDAMHYLAPIDDDSAGILMLRRLHTAGADIDGTKITPDTPLRACTCRNYVHYAWCQHVMAYCLLKKIIKGWPARINPTPTASGRKRGRIANSKKGGALGKGADGLGARGRKRARAQSRPGYQGRKGTRGASAGGAGGGSLVADSDGDCDESDS
jgi:hypothetical protein